MKRTISDVTYTEGEGFDAVSLRVMPSGDSELAFPWRESSATQGLPASRQRAFITKEALEALDKIMTAYRKDFGNENP